jgi:hypothetical protein
MRELLIANNMVAIARGHKPPKHHAPKPPKGKKGKHKKPKVAAAKTPAEKRSAMLRMIMPFLSRETGEKLAIAITSRDANKFASLWDSVKKEIVGKLEAQKHQSIASDNPARDFAFGLNYEDAEKLVQVFKWVLSRLATQEAEAVDPCPLPPMETDECCTVPQPNAEIAIDQYPQLAQLYAQMLASQVQ